MAQTRGEVLQGTLDLIVLKTLDALGPLHGYGIAVRIQQVSSDLLSSTRARFIQRCCASNNAAGSPRNGASPTIIAKLNITRSHAVGENSFWRRQKAGSVWPRS